VYGRDEERRLIGHRVQRTGPLVWAARQPRALREAALRSQPRLVLLLQGCAWRSRTRAEVLASRCMPRYLRDLGYRVTAAERAGYRWIYAVVARPQPPGELVTVPAVAGR
jgi:hypothetical protein